MNRTLASLAAAMVALLLAASRAPAAERDELVAIVGKEPITHGDLVDYVGPELLRLESTFRGATLRAKVEETLDAGTEILIRRKLLLLAGQRMVTEQAWLKKEVERQVDLVIQERAREEGGDEALRAALRRAGMSFQEYRTQVRESLLRNLVLYRHKGRTATPPPEDVRAYYEKHKEEFRGPRAVRYRQIVLKWGNAEERQAARARAEQLVRQLDAGAPFDFLAKRFSQGPRAKEGGLWDFGEWGDKPESLRRPILALAEGAHSAPIETDDAIYIFRAEMVCPEGLRPFAAVQAGIQKRLEEQARRERESKLYARLEKEFFVERLRGGKEPTKEE